LRQSIGAGTPKEAVGRDKALFLLFPTPYGAMALALIAAGSDQQADFAILILVHMND
jgi:hypothetical protein